MTMQETALTLSLFAGMAALQFAGGTHQSLHPVRGRPVFPAARWSDLPEFRLDIAATMQQLAAAGALEDPEIAALRRQGDALVGRRQ